MDIEKVIQVFKSKINHVNEHINFIIDELNVEDNVSSFCMFIQKYTEDLFINKHFAKELDDMYDDIVYLQENDSYTDIKEWLKAKQEYYIHKILHGNIIPATTNILYNLDKQCEIVSYQNIVKFINILIKE